MKIVSLYSYVKNLLFPPLCIGCEKEGVYFCKKCSKELYSYPECCFYCKKSRKNYTTCPECSTTAYLDSVIVGFSYQGPIKESIKQIKYHGYTGLIPSLIQKSLYSYSLEGFSTEDTVICSVPMHRRKQYRKRGYNQSVLLAKELSKQTTIPYINLFKKIKGTRSQTKYSRTKRKLNILKSFRQILPLPDGIKNVIIVDDVITTGSTLTSLAKILKDKNQEIIVVGFCIARH